MNPFDKLANAVHPAVSGLTDDQRKKLERIQGRATLYELALMKGDQRLLFCYTRRTGRGIRDYMRHLRDTPDSWAALKAATGIDLATWDWNGWVPEFTGRTQREAIMVGELKFWNDLPGEGGKK